MVISLRRQFILVFALFAVAMSAVGGWISWRATSAALEAQLADKLRSVAIAAAEVGLQSSLVLPLRPGDEDLSSWNSTYQRLVRMRRLVDAAFVFRRGGTVLVSTAPVDSLPIGSQLHWLAPYAEELEEAWTVGEASTPVFQGEDGRYYMYGFARLEQSDAMLAVLMPADFLRPLDDFRRTVVIGSVLAAILAGLVAALLTTNVVKPLERLSRVALRIQRGRMSEPVALERGQELGRLARAMERMRRGIVQRDEQLRLMLSQVAHEIRNPLGGLELFASAAGDTEDPEERARILKRIREEVDALNQIINEFLAFARPLTPQISIHDAREPFRAAAELVEGELEQRGGGLVVELPDKSLLARADPDHVKRVALNLLRNAAQAGDNVWLSAEALNGEVVLTVSDDGPGVAEELRERIFDPFVTDREQGAGLGLAIVRRVLDTNGARVELVPPGEARAEGAEFKVYFRGSEDFPPQLG